MTDCSAFDLEKEALRPAAHIRMVPRLLLALETSVGLNYLFMLRQSFPWDKSGTHKHAWFEAFKKLDDKGDQPLRQEYPLDLWISGAESMKPYGDLDSVCLFYAADDIRIRLWRDSCFRNANGPIALKDQTRIMGQILKMALYGIPVQWALGFSRDRTRNVFRATRVEQKMDFLPLDRQPQSDDQKWHRIAKEIGVNDFGGLKRDVETYRSVRGDIDDFEHLVDAAAYDRLSADPGISSIDSFGHDRAVSAMKGYLFACLEELTKAAPDHALAVKIEFKLEKIDAADAPKKRASLKYEALQILQDCIERRSSNDFY